MQNWLFFALTDIFRFQNLLGCEQAYLLTMRMTDAEAQLRWRHLTHSDSVATPWERASIFSAT